MRIFSILTKEGREDVRNLARSDRYIPNKTTIAALNIIDEMEVRVASLHREMDALEAERDALESALAETKAERDNFGDLFERTIGYANRLVSEERGKRDEIEIDLILLRQQISQIKSIASAA